MKKVIISPNDKKAITFFEELDRRKEELKKKVEAKLEAISLDLNKPKSTAVSTSTHHS